MGQEDEKEALDQLRARFGTLKDVDRPAAKDDFVTIDLAAAQDGETVVELTAREVSGDERAHWWELAVAAYPPYAEYQTKTDRQIPVFVLE
mgnify:CR=1 FL=1